MPLTAHIWNCVSLLQTNKDILAIIECGAEPVFKPYNFTQFLNLPKNEKHVKMEAAQYSFSDAQLDALMT